MRAIQTWEREKGEPVGWVLWDSCTTISPIVTLQLEPNSAIFMLGDHVDAFNASADQPICGRS
jgi:hypothetical protein